MPASTARMLEIGAHAYVKEAYPEHTTLLWTARQQPYFWIDHIVPRALTASEYILCNPLTFARAMREVRAGRYDLVVVHLPLYSPWHPRHWGRNLAQNPMRPVSAVTGAFAASWLRGVDIPVPLAAIDLDDYFGIRRHNFSLLDKADIVFKRELPADRWQMLCGSAHPALPTRRIRSSKRWQQRLEKVHPIPLPVGKIDTEALWSGEFPEKTADVFFSGDTKLSSWVRRSGLQELRDLERRGVTIDVPTTRLSRADFYRRLSQAWLAWSPSGLGWECYRPFEAAQCLAVPVINDPTIERHRPLRGGEHIVQYDIAPGGLTRAVEAALADKDKLRRMASAARAFVLAHHTHHAHVDHVIASALESAVRRDRSRD